MHVLSVVGTRPEAVKMAPVITELEQRDGVRSTVCVTGQHGDMVSGVLDLWGIRPAHDLAVMRPKQTLTDVTTRVLTGLRDVLESERPDWVLVQGDTTTAMAASLAAFYARVSVGHVEAGLRTWDNDHPFPEEVNRRITGVVAETHFAPTHWAATNLQREGVDPSRIVVTGNTVIDALHAAAAMPYSPTGVLREITDSPDDVVLVTCHRRENHGRPLESVCRAMLRLVERNAGVRLVMPVHPSPHVHDVVHDLLGGQERITLLPPLDYLPLVHLIRRASFLLTDSGGLQEEATGFGKPVLVLRDETERPEGIHAGTARLVGTTVDGVLREAERLLRETSAHEQMALRPSPYGDGNAAKRIVDDLLGVDNVIDLTRVEDRRFGRVTADMLSLGGTSA